MVLKLLYIETRHGLKIGLKIRPGRWPFGLKIRHCGPFGLKIKDLVRLRLRTLCESRMQDIHPLGNKEHTPRKNKKDRQRYI